MRELRQLDPQLCSHRVLAPGIALCSVLDAQKLMRLASGRPPIFVRHLSPVQATVALNNSEQDFAALAIAISRLPMFSLLERGQRFAVQTRFAQPGDEARNATIKRACTTGSLNQQLAAAFAEETGAVESIKKPQVIISVLCAGDQAYAGISLAHENLSDWPGGMRHFAHTPEQISRAEFKLLEALEVFGVSLPQHGSALDLGAAPGGWTRLLLEAGMRVVAVDPAQLDPRLEGQPRLEHYRGYAAQYLKDAQKHHRKFDVITSDIRMDAREAAQVLVQAGRCLHPDGFILSTLKLPHTGSSINPLQILSGALRTLSSSFGLVRARQLFHNRQEVTVIMTPFLARHHTGR